MINIKPSSIPTQILQHIPLICWPDLWQPQPPGTPDTLMAWLNDKSNNMEPGRILKVKNIITGIAHDMVISLTFGLCSPYLAVTIALALYIKCLQWRYFIGRFVCYHMQPQPFGITNNDSDDMSNASARTVDTEQPVGESQVPNNCAPIMAQENGPLLPLLILNKSVMDTHLLWDGIQWPLVCTSCLFFTIICWDMAGDEVGWDVSIWIPPTVMSVPLLLWVGNGVYDSHYFHKIGFWNTEKKLPVAGAIAAGAIASVAIAAGAEPPADTFANADTVSIIEMGGLRSSSRSFSMSSRRRSSQSAVVVLDDFDDVVVQDDFDGIATSNPLQKGDRSIGE
jgi:hypothetical protein